MSFLITFRPAGFTVAKYDEGVSKINCGRQGAPKAEAIMPALLMVKASR